MPPLAVELRNITKVFSEDVTANNNVSLGIMKGEVHALIGENGAGKTTLMKILYGLCQPDSGKIFVNGSRANIRQPSDAIAMGIGMVHQHFMLIGRFSVAENIILGMEPVKGMAVDMAKARYDVRRLSERYGLDIEPDTKVADISAGMAQRVELLKVMYRSADILIFDEPTSILTPDEVESFFTIIQNLKQQGRTVILITHKLKEVFRIADRVTVMRKGRSAGVRHISKTNQIELTNMIIGRPTMMNMERRYRVPGNNILSIRDLNYTDKRGVKILDELNLEIKEGEIVGIAGLRGSGQQELMKVLSGLEKSHSGRLIFDGNDITAADIRQRSALGISYIPADRHKYAVAGNMTIELNMLLGRQYESRFISGWAVNRKELAAYSEQIIDRYGIEPGDRRMILNKLSGGNQQKVVVGRELDKKPRFIIASEPSRGIDIASTERVYGDLLRARDNGAAVLLVSSDISEIMSFADRIAVMYNGRIAGILDSAEVTERQIMLLMTSGPG